MSADGYRLFAGARTFNGSAAKAQPAQAGNNRSRHTRSRHYAGGDIAAAGSSKAPLLGACHGKENRMTLAHQLADGLAAMGLSLPSDGQAKLTAYVHLIEKWNRVHNLTAVRDPEQMVALHLLDSLSILPHLTGMRTLLDVGTG